MNGWGPAHDGRPTLRCSYWSPSSRCSRLRSWPFSAERGAVLGPLKRSLTPWGRHVQPTEGVCAILVRLRRR